jgi:hypothetical protein
MVVVVSRPAPAAARSQRDDAADAGPCSGAVVFARYAYPPNALGYCGPADSGALLHYAAAGVADQGLAQLARGFEGAWPYLELIAGATGIKDPLDRRVVEAYWVGSWLLDRVGVRPIGDSLEERFRRRIGRGFSMLADGVMAGGVPHHSFHVFGVYPWVGFLGDGRRSDHALEVLDRCRVRWGRVIDVAGDQVTVRSQPLRWDGRALRLGPAEEESARRAVAGVGLVGDLQPGHWVSLHWDWVCDRLSRRQLAALRRYTSWHLDIVNRRLAPSGLAGALGSG